MRTRSTLGLTVKHRTLIHLLDHRLPEGIGRAGIAPASISQNGIAEAVGIYSTHASRAVKELEENGLVSEKVSYVEGAKKKCRTYSLTSEGISKARDIKKRLEEKTIFMRGLGGQKKRVKLSEANDVLEKEIGVRCSSLKIVNSLSDKVLDCKNFIQKEKEYADFMERIIGLGHLLSGGNGKNGNNGWRNGWDEIKACLTIGEIYVCVGRRDKAAEFLERSLDTFTQLGVEMSVRMIRRLRQISKPIARDPAYSRAE